METLNQHFGLGQPPGRPRLLIADDHALLMEGVRMVVAKRFDVIGTASNGRELLMKAEQMRPNLVVLDIGMPLLNGMEALRQLRKTAPWVSIVMLTQQSDPEFVREAFGAGARGYVLKQDATEDLVSALEAVSKGEIFLSSTLRSHFGPSNISELLDPTSSYERRLTDRQRQVLQLVAEGKSAKEIAVQLSISVKTVDFHKAAIMNELGLRSTAELTRYALSHGIIQN